MDDDDDCGEDRIVVMMETMLLLLLLLLMMMMLMTMNSDDGDENIGGSTPKSVIKDCIPLLGGTFKARLIVRFRLTASSSSPLSSSSS